MQYVEVPDEALVYLSAKDEKMARLISEIGPIQRPRHPDLTDALVHAIVGQQISTAAQETIYARLVDMLGAITPETLLAHEPEELQACGLSFRKVSYIQDFAKRVYTGTFDIAALKKMDDAQVIRQLVTLKGIGEWTAEMLLLFCLNRPDVLSFSDLGIQRGLRMVYHHRAITPQLFARYKRRYSPYGSVASLYLWEVSRANIPGFDKDFAPSA